MVPGPAGEGGGASEGYGAENTVSWAREHSQSFC